MSGTWLRLGLVITTIGRPGLEALLWSAARSVRPPAALAIANQSGAPLHLPADPLPFPVTVVTSEGGASRGRNAAVAALTEDCDVLGFPNDDSRYDDDIFPSLLETFASDSRPAGVACGLMEQDGLRFDLPEPCTALTRRSVWRAIEPATFVTREAFERVGGFREDLGSGAPSPWGSGEGTDLLLRMLEADLPVLSRRDLLVHGAGERRRLSDTALVAKHRAYARGTGYLYREHDYSWAARLRIVLAPIVKARRHDDRLGLSLRLAAARTAGRVEGLSGRPLLRSRAWEQGHLRGPMKGDES